MKIKIRSVPLFLLSLASAHVPENDLLGRMYEEFHLFGGAEVRILAADSDVADAPFDSQYVLSLEDMRKHFYNEGRLPDTGAAPGELSLALTDDETVMRISWATMDKIIENPRIELVSPCTSDGCIYSATTTTYTVPQRWWPQFNGSLHSSLVSGLISGETYSYRACSDSSSPANNTESCSDYYTFKAPPPLSSPTSIAIIGDQGTVMPLGFAISEKLTAVQDELNIDAVIHVGDLSYAGIDTAFPHLNVSKDDEFEWIWDLWQLQNQPIAATRPYMIGIGNHEAWYNWTAVTSRFQMPYGPYNNNNNNNKKNNKNVNTNAVSNVSVSNPPFWYSMNHGYVHWIHTCSEFPMDNTSTQGQWLLQDLSYASLDAQRLITPWIIITIHRPPYSSETSWIEYRNDLELLFNKYHVDVVISGHIHAYERTHSVGNNGLSIEYPKNYHNNHNDNINDDNDDDDVYINPIYPIYITQGNSGALQVEKWVHPVPDWSAVRWANGYTNSYKNNQYHQQTENENENNNIYPYTYTDTFGFGVARFVNATSMLYESIPVTGNFSDKFWISKNV